MEVHHPSHSSPSKWRHYFWEFFMLFLAITLGFFVENLREHQAENRRAKEYAQLLRLDLMADTATLTQMLKNWASENKKVEFINNLVNKDINEISIGELRIKDTTAFLIDEFLPNNATYDQMKSSGELRYFSDVMLINKLAMYYWQIKRNDETLKFASSVYGGYSNQRFMDYQVRSDEFLKKSASMDSSLHAVNSGYHFDYWFEAKKITEANLEKVELKKMYYPALISAATEIISQLNKEYNLK